MKDKIIELVSKLEKEDDIYSKIILSGLIEVYYNIFLTKEELNEFNKLYFWNNDRYDTLYDDVNEHIKISDRVMGIFYESDYGNYDLMIKKRLNIKEVDEIASEILNSISKEAYNNYKLLKENNRIITKYIKNANAYCINGMGYEQDFIILNDDFFNTSDLTLTLIHELGHTYENEIMKTRSKKDQIWKYKGNYIEVVSRFFERVAMDYMIENNIYKDDNNIILNKHYGDLIYNFYSLDKIIYHFQNGLCVYNNNSYRITKEINYDEIEERFHGKVPNIGNYRKHIDYGYGSLLGEYLYNIYKENKKEGLLKVRDFILNMSVYSNKEMLDKIKFLENDLSFFKPSVESNMTYIRNRPK